MALNESDVQSQIKQMMAFIDLEAREKVEEIDTKAEEEFQIEKSRLVHIQRRKIMDDYSRKEKQLELTKKIQDSSLKNDSRLKVLQSRENHIKNLIDEAEKRLTEVSKDPKRYQPCLVGLIVQGLLSLLESEVEIKCRKCDEAIVKSLLPTCLAKLKEQTQIDCVITIKNEYLPDSCAGGVEVQSKNGKIKAVNTLEARIQQVSERMMPQLREILFGSNENRKFRD